jgi:subtilase family serine protease
MSSGRNWLVVAAVAALACAPAFAQTPQITQRVDESRLVTLSGSTRPEAVAANDRGRVADDFPMQDMQLQLSRSAAQEQAFQQAIDAMYTPGSPNYHNWMTAAKIGAEFGVAEKDIQTVSQWLTAHGFRINTVYPSRMLIDFSGTAGQVRDAFATEIHKLQVGGARHVANMSDPKIPAALAPVVVGIVSLNDFRPHKMRKPHANYTFTYQGSPTYALVPADIYKIYNFSPLFAAGITGKGETIVAIEDSDLYTTADFTKFRSEFGLASSYPSGNLTTLHPGCSDPGVPSGGDDGEAATDVEYASAAAPNASIVLASCPSTNATFGGLTAMQNMINETDPPTIFSISYGNCEAEDGQAQNLSFFYAYKQAAAEGISIFVAAGDENAASCDAGENEATHGIGISGWASTQFNVAVGGTDFEDTYLNTNSTYWSSSDTSTYGSAKSYIPEIPWNDSCASYLSALYNGSTATYGSTGFCNTRNGEANYLIVDGGSGGPSGCAVGTPAQTGVVGGNCAGYGKPYWQSGILGNPADGVRDIPDVSLFAGDGVWNHYYIDCWSDVAQGGTPCSGAPSGWDSAGGTSFATPIMAGVQALIQQKLGKAQGNPDVIYYALAKTEYGSTGSSKCNSVHGWEVATTCIFYDVSTGDMDVNCRGTVNCYIPSGTNGVLSTSRTTYNPAYHGELGWDFATGIGTVNVANLVNGWPK